MNIVSRGSLVFAWMSMTGNENPFYEYFDTLISAKSTSRSLPATPAASGCLADATDVCRQIEELVRLGELDQARMGAQCTGHGRGTNTFRSTRSLQNMEVQKTLHVGVPFCRVLDLLVTDIGPAMTTSPARSVAQSLYERSRIPLLCHPG